LPPKLHRPAPQPPPFVTHGPPSSLPPPLIPTPSSAQSPPIPAPRQNPPRPSTVPKDVADSESQESQDNACNECSVCLDKAVDCVLYTCGHLCVCYECAQDIMQSQGACPICRKEIKDIIKIFRS
jgi:protein neuralized